MKGDGGLEEVPSGDGEKCRLELRSEDKMQRTCYYSAQRAIGKGGIRMTPGFLTGETGRMVAPCTELEKSKGRKKGQV